MTRLRYPDILLDEFVNHLDPIPWHKPRVPSLKLEDQHRWVMTLVDNDIIRRVGIARRVWEDGERHNDILYGPTKKGLAHWEANVKGRIPPSTARADLPKYRGSQLAAAMSPCDVFDLPRVPWRHKLKRDLE